MGLISQNGVDYPAPSVKVQSDGTATDLTNDRVPTGQTIKSYLNSTLTQVASQTSKTITSGGVTANVYFYKFKNGVKLLSIQSLDFPASMYTSDNNFIPTEYRSVFYTQNQFFAGMNNQYNQSSNTERTRMIAIVNGQGILYIYNSYSIGIWVNAFYV